LKHREYLVIIEKSNDGFGAYVPDLPGCVTWGSSKAEVKKLIKEVIKIHIEGMLEDGEPIPKPSAESFEHSIDIAA